jgi:hypothetical protein
MEPRTPSSGDGSCWDGTSFTSGGRMRPRLREWLFFLRCYFGQGFLSSALSELPK